MSKPSFVYVTYIRATPEKVLDAITDRELTAQYWGHPNVSDWKAGSRGNTSAPMDRTSSISSAR